DGAAAALGRVLDTLQGDQGVDAANRAHGRGRLGRPRFFGLAEAERSATGAARLRRASHHAGSVRPVDSHQEALLWRPPRAPLVNGRLNGPANSAAPGRP